MRAYEPYCSLPVGWYQITTNCHRPKPSCVWYFLYMRRYGFSFSVDFTYKQYNHFMISNDRNIHELIIQLTISIDEGQSISHSILTIVPSIFGINSFSSLSQIVITMLSLCYQNHVLLPCKY